MTRLPITSTYVSIFVPVVNCSTGYVPRATTTKRQFICHEPCPEACLTIPSDAADLVRIIFKAVKYIHDSGVVHRGSQYLPSIPLSRSPSSIPDI